jgi:glucose-6-phosphate isomerase
MFKFTYEKTALVPDKKIEKSAQALAEYREHLQKVAKKKDYQELEASLQLGYDSDLWEQVQLTANKIGISGLKYVVVVGIGGSNLGALAINQALFGSLDHLDQQRQPKLLFLDTVSSLKLKSVAQALKGVESNQFLIIAISKSGTTTETVANLEALTDQLRDQFDNLQERTVIISDQGSALWKQAEEFGLDKIAVPKMVGGRFSVFSAVGLLPLYFSGLDIESLQDGARRAVEDCVSEDLDKNKALVSAALTYWSWKKGAAIHNTFFFNPELEAVGKWYRQLMGESIGKKQDLNGKNVRRGITPIVSIGSTDLHSMAQLYFGGPDDKFTNIVYCLSKDSVNVPSPMNFEGLVKGIEGKSLTTIMKAMVGGVIAAYENNELPFLTIELPEISELMLGYYLQFRMIEIMYLAQLLEVNAFDQPSVEDYKKETRRLLGQ